ncbi:hypothetical protein E2542_SST10749 [Spatholobus suberectus]|nr:hypothetical protein E2542_SST10749 [Spatholobus suberectus]
MKLSTQNSPVHTRRNFRDEFTHNFPLHGVLCDETNATVRSPPSESFLVIAVASDHHGAPSPPRRSAPSVALPRSASPSSSEPRWCAYHRDVYPLTALLPSYRSSHHLNCEAVKFVGA